VCAALPVAAAPAARPLQEHEDELGDASAFLAGAYRSVLPAHVPD